MPDRFSDPNWWPRPRPQEAPSTAKVIAGAVLTLLAIGGAAAAIVSMGHSGHRPSSAGCRGTSPVSPVEGARACADQAPTAPRRGLTGNREAFLQCMRSAGARPSGRFGGSSRSVREAVEVCRSIARNGDRTPTTPTRPPPADTTAPVA